MRLKWLFGFLLLLVVSGCSPPEYRLHNGESIVLSDYRGQWLLINYWAVWCKPCVTEIPELNALDQTEGISVLGYNFDQQVGEPLAQQVKELNILFPLLTEDPAVTVGQDTPNALPATIVINPQGQFAAWLLGPQTQQTIKDQISKLSLESS